MNSFDYQFMNYEIMAYMMKLEQIYYLKYLSDKGIEYNNIDLITEEDCIFEYNESCFLLLASFWNCEYGPYVYLETNLQENYKSQFDFDNDFDEADYVILCNKKLGDYFKKYNYICNSSNEMKLNNIHIEIANSIQYIVDCFPHTINDNFYNAENGLYYILCINEYPFDSPSINYSVISYSYELMDKLDEAVNDLDVTIKKIRARAV